MRLKWLAFFLLLSHAAAIGHAKFVFADDTSIGVLDGAFGNTISIVNSVGDETLVWLKRDKTYESKLPNGQRHKGIWSVVGELICFEITEPVSDVGAVPICGELIANKKPGDQWESMVSDGSIVTVSIKEGVVGK